MIVSLPRKVRNIEVPNNPMQTEIQAHTEILQTQGDEVKVEQKEKRAMFRIKKFNSSEANNKVKFNFR